MHKTRTDIVIEAINFLNKPLQYKDIEDYVVDYHPEVRVTDNNIRVAISQCISKKWLAKVKYKDMPHFYVRKTWLKGDGSFKTGITFDPIFKEFKIADNVSY